MSIYDFAIVGGGIVGVSTAWQLKRQFPDANIVLLEKESSLAQHQTGHNSGVIHAGVYYQPGSLKADFCKRGAAATYQFCQQYRLPVEQCGKLLVATDEIELERMAGLEKRCTENEIKTHRLSGIELSKREPNITGSGALLVPATGITNYRQITTLMGQLFLENGGEVKLGKPVISLRETVDAVQISLPGERLSSRYVVACAGLMADRIAQLMGIDINFRIVPFRGEYYQLTDQHHGIVNHLIYPIPDPELPFLGVHLTRMIDGSVTVGPNAVLGWKREGYGRFNINTQDTWDMMRFVGFWRVIRDNLSAGIGELKDSFYKPGYLRRIKKYCPKLEPKDLSPYPAGIRAQAVMVDGTLVHDFLFAETARSLHVCNAPSPAATSAIPIGEYLVEKIKEKFGV